MQLLPIRINATRATLPLLKDAIPPLTAADALYLCPACLDLLLLAHICVMIQFQTRANEIDAHPDPLYPERSRFARPHWDSGVHLCPVYPRPGPHSGPSSTQ